MHYVSVRCVSAGIHQKKICVCVHSCGVSRCIPSCVCFPVWADGGRGSVHTILICFVYPPFPRESINSQLDPVNRSHMTRQAFNEETVGPACRRFSAFYLFSPARVAPSLLWRWLSSASGGCVCSVRPLNDGKASEKTRKTREYIFKNLPGLAFNLFSPRIHFDFKKERPALLCFVCAWMQRRLDLVLFWHVWSCL